MFRLWIPTAILCLSANFMSPAYGSCRSSARGYSSRATARARPAFALRPIPPGVGPKHIPERGTANSPTIPRPKILTPSQATQDLLAPSRPAVTPPPPPPRPYEPEMPAEAPAPQQPATGAAASEAPALPRVANGALVTVLVDNVEAEVGKAAMVIDGRALLIKITDWQKSAVTVQLPRLLFVGEKSARISIANVKGDLLSTLPLVIVQPR